MKSVSGSRPTPVSRTTGETQNDSIRYSPNQTPIYITAITGATIAALVAGFPIAGSADMTIAKMVISGLNPVIADMTGILLFIGIMQATGFMDVIIRDIVRVGNKLGGGTGVCTAGGIALTGFTQPVITAVITGPAAVRLGVDPNKCAGISAHAGHIGNLAGFTHPTQVALIATAGISFGLFNVLGLIACLVIFLVSAIRCNADMRRRGVKITPEERAKIMAQIESRTYATTSCPLSSCSSGSCSASRFSSWVLPPPSSVCFLPACPPAKVKRP